MADVRRLGSTEPLEGAEWVVVERDMGGRFQASGLSSRDEAVFGPQPFDSESQAVGAAQSWAFHNNVPVIFVRNAT